MRRSLPILLLMSLFPATAGAQSLPATCRADLAQVDASFDDTQARLNRAGTADQTEKCAAVAHHLDVMSNGRDVFLRCLPPGHDRDENVAQLNASIADFRQLQAQMKCG